MPELAMATHRIPTIAAYPMPNPDGLPPNTAGWRIDPARAVLLIHGMQRYFVAAFPAGASPVLELVGNLAQLRGSCLERAMPVAYTAQPGAMAPHDRGLLADFWGPGMTVSPADRDVISPLRPTAGDWQLIKWRYSAFFRTDLAARMRAADQDQLVIGGVYAHVGVMMSAADAFTQDIQAFVVADAVADFSASYHRQALQWAAERCAVVLTTHQALGQLAHSRAKCGQS